MQATSQEIVNFQNNTNYMSLLESNLEDRNSMKDLYSPNNNEVYSMSKNENGVSCGSSSRRDTRKRLDFDGSVDSAESPSKKELLEADFPLMKKTLLHAQEPGTYATTAKKSTIKTPKNRSTDNLQPKSWRSIHSKYIEASEKPSINH